MSRVLNIISQIIHLAKLAKVQVERGQFSSVKRLFRVLLSVEKEELKLIEHESGSKELYNKCLEIYRDSAKLFQSNGEIDKKKTIELLDRLIGLERHALEEISQPKKGLNQETLKIIDPYIRELVNEINKLSFVKTTHFACSGHFPSKLTAYVMIEYDVHAKTKHNIHHFHTSLSKIVRNSETSVFQMVLRILPGSKRFGCSYYLGSEEKQTFEELRDTILSQWEQIAKLVVKYKDNDSLTYKKEKILLQKELLNDNAVRMVYCPKCDKYVYTNTKRCQGCGTDMEILKIQG